MNRGRDIPIDLRWMLICFRVSSCDVRQMHTRTEALELQGEVFSELVTEEPEGWGGVPMEQNGTPIENLSNICRTSIEHLNMYRDEALAQICRTSIEIYRTSVENLWKR